MPRLFRRSSITGRAVSKKYADANPDTTVTERERIGTALLVATAEAIVAHHTPVYDGRVSIVSTDDVQALRMALLGIRQDLTRQAGRS